jgi:hypothetical protein
MGVLVAIVGLSFLRAAAVLMPLAREPDPIRLMARHLEASCPATSCVATVPDYWTYWPIRYLAPGVALNETGHSWMAHPTHSLDGRSLVRCVKEGEETAAAEAVVFPAGRRFHGLACFKE